MATLHWDFRNIFSIGQEGRIMTCRAKIESASGASACFNAVEEENQKAVADLLQEMNRTSSYEVISESIEQLAAKLLCKQHRDDHARTGPCQITSDWTQLFQQRWTAMRKEHSRKSAEIYKFDKTKETFERSMVLSEKEGLFQSNITEVYISCCERLPPSTAVSPTENTLLVVPPLIRRDTFGNDTEETVDANGLPFSRTTSTSPKPLMDSKIDRRPSLRILVQSVLLPSPPETPVLSRSPIMHEGAADFMSTDSFLKGYYEENTPLSATGGSLSSREISDLEEDSQSTHLSVPEFERRPPIPPKSPRRSKARASSQPLTLDRPDIPTTPISPVSPISHSGHSKTSSCSSTTNLASLLPSPNPSGMFEDPTYTPLKPYNFTIPNYSFPAARTTNSSSPKISSPTPTSPLSAARPKFITRGYDDDAYDYFNQSLNMTPYAISYESLRSDGTPPRIFPKSIVGSFTHPHSYSASTFSLHHYNHCPSITSIETLPQPQVQVQGHPYQLSGLREEFDLGVEVCGVCRLARGDNACDCLWAGSDRGLDSDDDQGEEERKGSRGFLRKGGGFRRRRSG
ncbi:hypothetical protein BJ875DRAFT_295734 [Amylocarpus encephaloides]|uniref:Uncharacterized protein n=1 Tax=Amylocarpus encephaloides TaxID=45428 RepID=A0A9P7YJ02_9HELO|nr:hypothetical protein BJ875DRAFT_295734 [Amylocarpus encephaloides]